MRNKGSRFTLGVWGLRVCSLDVAFVAATVRNRPQPFAWGSYGRAHGKFCRGGHFWRFQTFGCFVSRGRRGTSWHSDVFCNVSKSFCVASAILLQRFQKVRSSFRGRRGTLDVSSIILCAHGRRSTLDVWCFVFFANRIGRAASSGDKVQIPWHAWQFVRCAENWRNIDFDVANLEVPKKTCGKTSILRLQSVKTGRSLARNARFAASGVSGFPVASPCLWGKLQNK